MATGLRTLLLVHRFHRFEYNGRLIMQSEN